jgi:tetratricopeptide (TPR) repeat protein
MHFGLHVISSICLAFCTVAFAGRCPATEYPLGQISLGKPLPSEFGANYKCSSLAEFSGATQCHLNVSPATQMSISDVLIESSSRKILYAYNKSYESDALDRVERRAISEISNTLDGSAPKRFSVNGAVVAVWGDVKLEKIDSNVDEYIEIKGSIEQRYGLLIDAGGDFKASKAESRPIYRVIGGDGLLLILSQDKPRQVVVQRLIVAAGSLSEKNFKSQVDQFLATDKGSLPDDYSKWPEIAFMIRRLALNTTPEIANRAVDEVFSAAPRQKYRSHVWALLPTSVIKHLKSGTYMAIDVFGEKTEFPAIRDKIAAQLNASSSEPFSDFLLYTMGRFDEAIQFNQKSPLRTVLVYAAAHSKLRKILTNVFQVVSKPSDVELLLDRIEPESYLDKIDSEDIQFRDTDSAKSSNKNYQELLKRIAEIERRGLFKYREKKPEEKNIDLAKRNFFNDSFYWPLGSNDAYLDGEPSLSQYIHYMNQLSERYASRALSQKIPQFRSLTDPLLPAFEEVLKDRSSPHSDDAAYFLGWLAYHRGNTNDALKSFEIAIALLPKVGSINTDGDLDLDYSYASEHQSSRILRMLLPEDALNRVQNSKVFSSRPLLWYTALAQLYHSGKYQLVVENARRALREFGVTVENLPVTTDSARISAAFKRLRLADDGKLEDIAYLYQASREAQQLETILSNIDKHSPASSEAQIRRIVVKYSKMQDPDERVQKKPGPKPLHRDLRQSLQLAQRALNRLPRNASFQTLREWLHYKRITLLAQFDPTKVADANAAFQAEFPTSRLLDDAMAEQVFAEAVILGDMAKATVTFNTLQQRYPAANAVDNSYSWIAIGWTCVGQPAKAREIDQQIVRRFPLTRHALFARERLRSPQACAALAERYLWDYRAMSWRERDRVDTTHDALRASPR